MKTQILYLLGAGRSGTTLLATLLNNHQNITTIGELHHFFNYLNDNNICSCGNTLHNCTYWQQIAKTYSIIKNEELLSIIKTQEAAERHGLIPFLLLGKKANVQYLKQQQQLFAKISTKQTTVLVDSSKYISRFLSLRQLPTLNVKGIYVVRDVRGVVNSFGKKVQTPKSAISTIVYYTLINSFAQLVCWFNKDVIKIRYEDLVDNPIETLNIIYKFSLSCNPINELSDSFDVPHIVGGNRLKTQKSISINKDIKWKENISRIKQIYYYILALPLMLLNRYKP